MTVEPSDTVPAEMIEETASLLTELEDADPQAHKELTDRMPFMTGEIAAGRWKADVQILVDLRDIIRAEIDRATSGDEDAESA